MSLKIGDKVWVVSGILYRGTVVGLGFNLPNVFKVKPDDEILDGVECRIECEHHIHLEPESAIRDCESNVEYWTNQIEKLQELKYEQTK